MGHVKNACSFPSHATYNFSLDLQLEVTPVENKNDDDDEIYFCSNISSY